MTVINQNEFNNFVEKMFDDDIMRMANAKALTASSRTKFLVENMLVVTMMFKWAGTNTSGRLESHSRIFKQCYCHWLRHIVGNNFQRKHPLQPLTFFCFDADGSRRRKIDWNRPQNPHIHALMLLHPETRKNYDRAELRELQGGNSNIDHLLIEKFDPTRSDFSRLVSYTTKAINPNQDHGILWDFLPNEIGRKITGQLAWHQNFANASAKLKET